MWSRSSTSTCVRRGTDPQARPRTFTRRNRQPAGEAGRRGQAHARPERTGDFGRRLSWSDSDKTLLDTLTDDRPTDPCELLQDDDLSESIDQWLTELTDKQREVVIRRFGLRGHESSTLEEVGQEIGLTRERVRQIQVEALKRLRRSWRRTACRVTRCSSDGKP